MAKSITALERLITTLSKLPGTGRRSAERMALRLIVRRESLLRELIRCLQDLDEKVRCCSQCGAITESDADPCRLCTDASRDPTVMCVVEDPSDVSRIENAGGYRGRYHVLMGKISPMNGDGPLSLRMEQLVRRLDSEPITEIILALNADMESDATAHFIRDMLAGHNVKITRPAMGIPAGSGIAYSDALTLSNAMKSRQQMGAVHNQQ